MNENTEKVAEYLDEHGWHQGSLRGPGESRCLIGAAHEVLDARGERYETVIAMEHAAMLLYPSRAMAGRKGLTALAAFNDHADTTREDVNLVLKHAGGAG